MVRANPVIGGNYHESAEFQQYRRKDYAEDGIPNEDKESPDESDV
jgi:hypothetical protein